eukprot:8191071-Lingulodinium_polyedra.AAC.1
MHLTHCHDPKVGQHQCAAPTTGAGAAAGPPPNPQQGQREDLRGRAPMGPRLQRDGGEPHRGANASRE